MRFGHTEVTGDSNKCSFSGMMGTKSSLVEEDEGIKGGFGVFSFQVRVLTRSFHAHREIQ